MFKSNSGKCMFIQTHIFKIILSSAFILSQGRTPPPQPHPLLESDMRAAQLLPRHITGEIPGERKEWRKTADLGFQSLVSGSYTLAFSSSTSFWKWEAIVKRKKYDLFLIDQAYKFYTDINLTGFAGGNSGFKTRVSLWKPFSSICKNIA